MEAKKSLLELLEDEEDEEDDGNYVGSDVTIEEEEIGEEKSDVENETNEITTPGEVEQIDYEFDLTIDPSVKEEGIFQSEEFATNQHTFRLGFFTFDEESTDLYMFIYPKEFENSFECSFEVTVEDENIQPNIFYGVFKKDFPIVKSSSALMHEIPTEPFKIHLSFGYIPGPNESRKYFNCVGLKNDGMTCYLNSLTQALFHIRGFRKIVFEINTEKSEIPKALASLFYNMQTSSKACSTRRLTRSFGWDTEDLFAQQDVQELMRILLDRLDSVSDNSASKMFKGVFKSYIRVPTLNYESSHNEDFYDLSLVVRDVPTIEESIKQFFQPDQMTGADQYQMPDNTKVDALKGFELIEPPTILCLHLRRFEYIDGDMQKISSRFEFGKDLELGGINYKLCTIIAHAGTFFGGHYCAFVHKDDRWLCFDDDVVTEITEEEAIEEKFGGEKRSFTAYVLFYCKETEMENLIDCPDPVITKTVLDDIQQHKQYRDVSYVREKNFDDPETQILKAQIPREGPLQAVKEVFAKLTEIDVNDIVLRSVDSLNKVKDIVTEEDFQVTSKFFVTDNPNIPIFPEFWVPGYDIKTMDIVYAEKDSLVEDLAKKICELAGIGPSTSLKCFLLDNYGSASEFEILIEDSCNLLFQVADLTDKVSNDIVAKTLEMQAYNPPEDSPIAIMGENLEIKDAAMFYELTNALEEVTIRHIVNHEEKAKMQLPLLLPIDKLLALLAFKFNVEADRILLFKPGDVRMLNKTNHPTVKAILEAIDSLDQQDANTICYDVAPESTKLVDRCDVTVVDKCGLEQKRFAIYLQKTAQSNEDLLKEIEKLVENPFRFYYSVNGFPREPVVTERAEFNHRAVIQEGFEEPKEGEVALKIIHRDQLLGDVGKMPFFKVVPEDKPVQELLKEMSEEYKLTTQLIKGTTMRPEIAEPNDLVAKDCTSMNVALVTKISLSALYGDNTELRMNK